MTTQEFIATSYITNVKTLTKRQKRVLWYLEKMSKSVQLKDIYYHINSVYSGKKDLMYPNWNASKSDWNDSTSRRQITSDLEAIEMSDFVNKVLIRSSGGIKIATSEEEAFKYMIKCKTELKRAYKKYKNSRNRLNAHGQTRLQLNKESKIITAYKEGA